MNTPEERAKFLADCKPRMIEILDHACPPGTVIDRDELDAAIEAGLKEYRSARRKKKAAGNVPETPQ